MGDFNIHVCCLENPLAKEFLSLIDSFDLVQFVNTPTHIQGHTLDLVLSHGLTVSDLVIEDHVFSDHKPIVFRVPTAFHITRPTKAIRWSRKITSTTSSEFSAVFNDLSQSPDQGRF